MLLRLRTEMRHSLQKCADENGYLYILVEPHRKGNPLLEARSVATGVVCIFWHSHVEELPDALQE